LRWEAGDPVRGALTARRRLDRPDSRV